MAAYYGNGCVIPGTVESVNGKKIVPSVIRFLNLLQLSRLKDSEKGLIVIVLIADIY